MMLFDQDKKNDPESLELPTKDEIVRYLKSLRVSLWGTYFLMEKERPADCADWILEQVASFMEWRQRGRPDSPIDPSNA